MKGMFNMKTMEEIQISKRQEQKLLSLLKNITNLGVGLSIIGLFGLIPIAITFYGNTGTNFISSPTIVFLIIGIMFWSQGREAQKEINNGNYQVYKSECKKVGWEYASVKNNDILSKNPNKDLAKVRILGSRKSIQAGEEIGILHVSKMFSAFSLNG